MRKEFALIMLWIGLLSAAPLFGDTYVRQPSVDILHYDISIQLNDSLDSITGITRIQAGILSESATRMWLDFEGMTVDKLLVGGVAKPFTHRIDRLTFDFDRTYTRDELVWIEVRYHGKPDAGLLCAKNRYGRNVVFAENWPDKAHHWFPAIDHPSDKASVSFEITIPERYEVVANGLLRKTVSLPYKRKLTQWEESKAIPTYCMVLAIAEFSVLRSAKDSLPLAWYVYPQDSEAASAKFRRTAQILSYFEGLFGPYPYDKLAQVEATIRLGAMENANTIFYGETLFDSPSEEPVAHEIAHQWFGNSLTASDWDHVWLSEGFATYLEALFYEHVNGPDTLKRRMEWYATKILSHKQFMDRPVIDPSQTDILKKLSPLTYEKGAWFLHMLRGILGDQAFFTGMRRFYEQFRGGIVTTAEFQKTMELAGGRDLSRFFRQWLLDPGVPEYRVSWTYDQAAATLEISVRQTQMRGLFDMPADIRISADNHRETRQFRIYESSQVIRIPFPIRPTSVEFDPENRILKTIIP